MDELQCPVPECSGIVVKVSIETYEETVYLDEDGQITESFEDERGRTDCYTDRYLCSADGVHEWATFEELERAVQEAD